MKINLHRDFSEIKQAEWDALLSTSATDVPFLRYDYLRLWWQHRGGGEWPQDAQLHILSGNEGGKLIGIAPFFSHTRDGQERLFLLGSVEISDYLDLICSPQDLGDFIPAFLAWFGSKQGSPPDLILENVPDRSPTSSLLQSLAPMSGWQTAVEKTYHTPSIPLAEDWDTYLAGIDKKQRHEIRRKLRRADENAEVDWYFADDPAFLDAEIDSFFDLMALDEDKEKFLSPQMRGQMHDIIHWASETRILHLSFLTIDGYKAAGYLCFDANGHILVYNSGFDFRFSQYSPGWVLLGYLIQDAIQKGRKSFDFMRGDEDYKYRFGGADGFVTRITLRKA